MADGTPQRIKRVVDSFAGGGGASTGIKWAIGRDVDAAINHDETAIAVHTANHPHALHFCEDVYQVDPRTVFPDDDIDVLWASPSCTHFSRAKGGKPVDQKIRGLAWSVIGWARRRNPRLIVVENVPEFITWGPLDDDNKPAASKAGLTFKRWVGYLKGAGYTVEWRELVAADYGAPTSRKRLFVVARCDGRPIVWPEPTHGDPKVQRDLFSSQHAQWRTAAECIDWNTPSTSIFDRVRPLAEPTQARIAAGIRDLVINNPQPFIVPPNRAPVLIQTGYGERDGQAPRVLDLHKPMGTLVAGGCKQGLVEAWLQRVGIDAVAGAPDHRDEVRGLLVKYFGNEKSGQALGEPLDTVTTRDRFGLVLVDGHDHVISDIRFRMLTVRECARGQGFPDDYVLDIGGTAKKDQMRLIGNSVVPHLAHAIVSANMESTT